jgi:cyclophilin family peptidyl-prolyl cis-trans isomerase
MRSRRPVALLATALLVAACTGGTAASPSPTGPTQTASAAPGAAGSGAAGSQAASADLSSCPTSQPAAMAKDAAKLVTIATSKGTIVIKVEGALSPIAAGNFVVLAQCGYYTGVVFHRLVPGFVIQGGDGTYGREPNLDAARMGQGGPAYTIQDEPVSGSYTRGAVAMAKTSAPNSANSQFFIVLADAQLPPTYQIFGHVTAGLDVVDAIAAMPNSGPPDNTATNPVAMDSVTVSNP